MVRPGEIDTTPANPTLRNETEEIKMMGVALAGESNGYRVGLSEHCEECEV